MPDAEAHLAGIGGGEVVKQFLVFLLPAAEHHQAAVLPDEKFPGLEHQVQALRRGETAHHPEDRPLESRAPAELLEQLGAALCLPGKIVGTVARWQALVGCRIPDRRVDAVEQAVQVIQPRAYDAVHAIAEFRGLDLLRVLPADRRDLVGVDDPGLEHAHLVVIFHAVDGQQVLGQVGQGVGFSRKHALVGDVVDREDGLERECHRVTPLGLPQENRQQAGLPVVAVHDIGLEVGQAQQFDHGLLEEDEAGIIVIVVTFARPIGQLSVKVFLAADQMECQARLRLQGVDIAGQEDIAHLDLQLVAGLEARHMRAVEHRAVAGHEDRQFVPAVRQRAGQGRHRIRQPACFEIRKQFAGRMGNSHVATLPARAHGSTRKSRAHLSAGAIPARPVSFEL